MVPLRDGKERIKKRSQPLSSHIFINSMCNKRSNLFKVIFIFGLFDFSLGAQVNETELADGIYFIKPNNCEYFVEVKSKCENHSECYVQLNTYDLQATRNKFILRKIRDNSYIIYTYSNRNVLQVKNSKVGTESTIVSCGLSSLHGNHNIVDSCQIWNIYNKPNEHGIYYIKTLCKSNRYAGIRRINFKRRKSTIELFDIPLSENRVIREWVFMKTDTSEASRAKIKFKPGTLLNPAPSK